MKKINVVLVILVLLLSGILYVEVKNNMKWGDILEKVALGEELSLAERNQLRLIGNTLQSMTGLHSKIEAGTGRFLFGLAEFDGDITAHGGDINVNSPSTTGDARFNLQNKYINQGSLWIDILSGNLVLQNEIANQQMVFNTTNGKWNFYDDDDDENVFYGDSNHGWHLLETDTDPAYADGYAILYFYSDGAGNDELRVRGKIGATETQVTIANISP